MHISVFSLLHKILVALKIIGARVLQNKVPLWVKKLFFKYFVGNSIQPFNGVRGICKNYIKFFGTDLNKVKCIMPYHLHSLNLVCLHYLLDEFCMHRVHLHTYDVGAAT